MTSLDWLQVSGIRSFDHTGGPQTIKFFKPLTIILGSNGAGKTTIIECLKCATTGELPPNCDRGKSFIHDPKVSGDSEVKGQIRLQFKSGNKKRYITVRSFQVSQKKKTTQFKQLEAVLQTKGEDGEVKNNSYKCTDMDKLIPECMGVSKAILENVIFCHQEEVNWPLSDSLSLKKKLDDIFSSTRYSKALEAIKKTKKEIGQQLTDYEKELAVAETEKSQSVKLKKEAESEVVKLQKLKESMEKYETEIQEIGEKVSKYEGVIEKINALKQKFTEKDTQKKMLQKQVSELYAGLEQEFTETDEEVKDFEKNFKKQLETLNQSKATSEQQLKVNETNKSSINKDLNTLNEELGKLKSFKETHESRLMDISAEIFTLAERYKISGYDQLPLNENQIESFSRVISKLYEDNKKAFDSMKMQNKTEVEKITKEINIAHQKKETILKQVNVTEQLKTKYEKEEKDLKEKLSKINTSEAIVRQAEEEFQQLKKELKEKQEKKEAESIKNQIEFNNKQSKEITQKITSINKELSSREKEKEISFKIQNLKEELTKFSSSLEEKLKDLKARYETVLGAQDNEATVANIEAKIKQLIKKSSEQVQSKNVSIQSTERSISVAKSKLESITKQESKIKKDIETKENNVQSVLPAGKTWEEAMSEADEAVSDLRNEVSMTEALKLCYENFVKLARSKHECPVCERGMNTEECSTFESLQMSKLEQTPRHLQKKKAKLEVAIQHQENIREIKPIITTIQSLKSKDLPDVEKELSNLKEEIIRLNSVVSKFTEEMDSIKQEEKKANDLLPSVADMRIMQSSIRSSQQRLNEQENELQKLGLPKDLVPYEELKRNQEESQALREKIAQQNQSLQGELEKSQNELTKLNNTVHQKQNLLQNLQFELKEMQRLNESLSQKQKDLQQTITDIAKQQQDIPTYERTEQSLSNQLTEIKEKYRKEEYIMEGTVSDYQQELSKLNALTIEMKRYRERNVEDSLGSVHMKITKLEVKLEENKKEYETLSENLKKYNSMLEKQNIIKKNIEANLKYREKKREHQHLSDECDKLSAEIEKITGSDASLDSYQDIKSLKERQTELSNKRSQISGARSTIKNRVKTIQDDLNSDQYKDIDNKHKSLLIKLVTTKHAVEDLDKYSKALEKALTKYHSMKMAEINEIIKELWQKTYRGNDIDTICIKCDTETENSRKTYNYRVVMVKGDVELQMRGRSSAGQKVLACLIIRLALAEAFSIDCGILALDEPTTNLDLDNINSLAESLRFLIEDRRKLSNFQLIVITHDEEFVKKLGRAEFVENYYRISKDPRSGGSMIEQQKIAE